MSQTTFLVFSIPMCRQFGLALAPWDAIASGRLLSKKALEARKQSGEAMRRGGGEQSDLERKYSEVLEEIGKEHDCDSVTAIALACECAQGNVSPAQEAWTDGPFLTLQT